MKPLREESWSVRLVPAVLERLEGHSSVIFETRCTAESLTIIHGTESSTKRFGLRLNASQPLGQELFPFSMRCSGQTLVEADFDDIVWDIGLLIDEPAGEEDYEFSEGVSWRRIDWR